MSGFGYVSYIWSMKNYLFFLAIVISGILISCSKGGPSNDIILEELTNGSFDDGLKFSKNGTFSWEIEDGPKISGKYEIGKLTKWENDAGYTGMRHLSWSITFTDVSGSTYWDEDNSMLLSYDWNHSRAKKKLILKGKSSYYPIECIKVVSGDKLIEKYWNEKNPETMASNKKETKEVLKEIAVEEIAVEEVTSETDKYYKIQDPDGYTNMRDAPGGSIIRRVLPNEKFKVSGESRKYKVVEFDNGETGYIHNSRVVEYR
jgi:hypothetical protein